MTKNTKVFSSGKTTCYNIVTDVDNENDRFTVYHSHDSINILDIGQSNTSLISRNDFDNEKLAKEIVKNLNEGCNFFDIDGEEYCAKDNRNQNLRRFEHYSEPAKFKLIKITREYEETLTYEDVEV